VNVAVSQAAQNIGFALPINTIKDSLRNFEETGSFDRPFLGVRYQMITQQAALVNEVPQGAYIVEVTPGSPAEKAGVQKGDIVTSFGGKKMSDDVDLAQEIATKKLGEEVEVQLYRTQEEKSLTLRVSMAVSEN
jgi:serine protease Do